jgi:hypothetical protein
MHLTSWPIVAAYVPLKPVVWVWYEVMHPVGHGRTRIAFMCFVTFDLEVAKRSNLADGIMLVSSCRRSSTKLKLNRPAAYLGDPG